MFAPFFVVYFFIFIYICYNVFMPITNEQANLIYEIVTVYKNSFSGLRYDYTYKERVNGSSPLNKSMSILWKSENFMHLCGIVRYEKNIHLSANYPFTNSEQFYIDALNGNLSIDSCIVEENEAVDNKVDTKLSLLKAHLIRLREDIKNLNLGGNILEFHGIARQSNLVLLFKDINETAMVPSSLRNAFSGKNGVTYDVKGIVTSLKIYDMNNNLVDSKYNRMSPNQKKSKRRAKLEKQRRKNNNK